MIKAKPNSTPVRLSICVKTVVINPKHEFLCVIKSR